jgi:hypothetical protein
MSFLSLGGALFGIIGGLIGAMIVRVYLRRLRKRSTNARQRADFKTRLPGWVKLFELFFWVACFVAISYAFISGVFVLHHLLHLNFSPDRPSKIASFLLTLPCLFAALVPALMAANLISWSIPPVRRANELAMRDLPAASYGRSMKDLARVGAVLVPISAIAILVGVFDPWMK